MNISDHMCPCMPYHAFKNSQLTRILADEHRGANSQPSFCTQPIFHPPGRGGNAALVPSQGGYISEDGKFMKLFNAFSLENEGFRLPIGFAPIEETYRMDHRLEPLPPGLRKSESVQVIGGGLSVSG